MISTLTVLLALLAPPAQAAIGRCYQGAISREDGSQTAVILRGALQESLYRVYEFTLGAHEQRFSGSLVGADTLRFNSNNAYIPGGNATYNLDIELVFDSSGENARGSLRAYAYAAGDGLGGFGQAGGELTDSGTITLHRCE